MNNHELMPLETVFKQRVEKTSGVTGVKLEIDGNHESVGAQVYKAVNQLSSKIYAVTAEQIMSSPVVTLTPSATLHDALTQFKQYNIRHFPVVSSEEKLVGIVSERDVLRCLAGVVDNNRSGEKYLLNDEIRTMMKGRVLAASLDADIRYIARLFVEQGIGAMPIVSDTYLKGIITRRDVLSAVIRYYMIELWA
ncbi:MAG: CBS domain-containing protein [Porticoccus sp.]|nr:CBS domain-containing protein [Porticoccus sp.]